MRYWKAEVKFKPKMAKKSSKLYTLKTKDEVILEDVKKYWAHAFVMSNVISLEVCEITKEEYLEIMRK